MSRVRDSCVSSRPITRTPSSRSSNLIWQSALPSKVEQKGAPGLRALRGSPATGGSAARRLRPFSRPWKAARTGTAPACPGPARYAGYSSLRLLVPGRGAPAPSPRRALAARPAASLPPRGGRAGGRGLRPLLGPDVADGSARDYHDSVAKRPRKPRDVPVMCLSINWTRGVHLETLGVLLGIATAYQCDAWIETVDKSEHVRDILDCLALAITPHTTTTLKIKGSQASKVATHLRKIQSGRWVIID